MWLALRPAPQVELPLRELIKAFTSRIACEREVSVGVN